MKTTEEWIKREFERAERVPRLESGLLTGNLSPYIAYRLRVFLLRVVATALIHVLEFPFVYHLARPGTLSPILLFAALMALSGQWWWGTLETMRADVREYVEAKRVYKISRAIEPWLRLSLGVALLLLVAGGALTWILAYAVRLPYFSATHAVMFIYLIRAVCGIPISTYHSGIYAVRRVYRPIALVFAVDFLGLSCAFLTRQWLGEWALPLSLALSSLVQAGVALYFVRRMYLFMGWDVPFPPRRGKLPEREAIFGARTLLSGLAGVVMSLDCLIIIAVSLREGADTKSLLPTVFFLIAPLFRACHDWAMLFFPDIRALNLELFRTLHTRFSAAVNRTATVVAFVLWALAIGAAAALLGSKALPIVLLLGPLFFMRSLLAFSQIRAFSAHYFLDITLGGICFIGGSLAVPRLAASDSGQVLLFAALYAPILGLTGLRRFRLLRPTPRDNVALPAEWFGRLERLPDNCEACSITLPRETGDALRRELTRHLARQLHPEGAVTIIRDRIVLAYDPSGALRKKTEETLIHSAGTFESVEWFAAPRECRRAIEKLCREEGAVSLGLSPAEIRRAAEQRFSSQFPEGRIVRLDGDLGASADDATLEPTLLGAAAAFARNWQHAAGSKAPLVSTLVENGSITTIFIIPKGPRASSPPVLAWEDFVTTLNLRSSVAAVKPA